MRKIFLCLVFMPSLLMAQIQIYENSTIEKVTVYQQGAKITNKASVNIKPGNNEVILEGIPLNIDQNSIQVRVGGKAILLSATSGSKTLEDNNIPKRLKELEDSIKAIDKDLLWLNSEKTVYQGEEQIILANQKLGTAEEKFAVDELIQLSSFYRSRLLDIKKRIYDIDTKVEAQNNLKSKLLAKLNQIRHSQRKVVGQLKLSIESKITERVRIEASYLTYQAGWAPIYDVRANSADEPINLVYKANIYQTTGLNWDKIDLTISTGNPTGYKERPKLNSWYINFYEPIAIQYKRAREAPAAAPSMASNMFQEVLTVDDEESIEIDKPLIGYGVNQTTNRVNAEYTIEASQTIPSDGKQHLVAMAEYELNSRYTYHAVPKLDQSVYLLAKVADYGNYNLLPGNANLFFDGMYLGKTVINPNTTMDSMLLSLGQDENITVRRKSLQDFSERQVVGNNIKETKAWEITIRNNHDFEIELDLLDQVPISQNEQIEVKIEELNEAEYNEDYGSLLWKMNIKPSETRRIRFIYSVKYPKGKTISGL